MVQSPTLAITTNGEHLTYGGFFVGEIVLFGNLKFIARGTIQALSSWEQHVMGHHHCVPFSRTPLMSSI
jgi:hypothetical protein